MHVPPHSRCRVHLLLHRGCLGGARHHHLLAHLPLQAPAERPRGQHLGTAQTQTAPGACYRKTVPPRGNRRGRKEDLAYPQETREVPLPLEASRVDVDLQLEHRQKGLLWYSTYAVSFSGAYTFRNTSGEPQQVHFSMKYPPSAPSTMTSFFSSTASPWR